MHIPWLTVRYRCVVKNLCTVNCVTYSVPENWQCKLKYVERRSPNLITGNLIALTVDNKLIRMKEANKSGAIEFLHKYPIFLFYFTSDQ